MVNPLLTQVYEMNALLVLICIAMQDDLGSLLRNAARYSKYETMVQLLDAGTSVNSKDIVSV